MPVLHTPDDRYIVVRGVLWRAVRPDLSDAQRTQWVHALMTARRDVKHHADDPDALKDARARVHAAKVELGERGPIWWTDGAPDFNRYKVENTPYADWYLTLDPHG